MTSYSFVLDADGKPLSPTKETKACIWYVKVKPNSFLQNIVKKLMLKNVDCFGNIQRYIG